MTVKDSTFNGIEIETEDDVAAELAAEEAKQAGADTGEEDESGHPDGQEDEELFDEDGNRVNEDGHFIDEEGNLIEEELDEDGEPVKKEGDKVTGDERISQLIEDNKKLRQDIERLEKQQQAAVPPEVDFVVLDNNKVEAHVATLEEEAEELRAGGKLLEAARKERELQKFLDNIEENENRRKIWEEKKRSKDTSQSEETVLATKLEEAAEFYREKAGISKEAFTKLGAAFTSMRQSDALLEQEFIDRAKVSPVGAIRWAHEILKTKSTSSNSTEKKKRILAKKGTFAGGAAGGGKTHSARTNDIINHAKETGTTEAWAAAIAAKTHKPRK